MSEAEDPAREADSGSRAPTRGRKRRFVGRWTRRTAALVVALVAAIVVSFFSIDLGRFWPHVRGRAEQAASDFLKRPLHIGGISAYMTPGKFRVDNVVIEGRSPEDRPFFRADHIYVHVPWWRLITLRELHVEVEIVDWQMTVETWEGGLHNVPDLNGPDRPRENNPRPFDTTVRFAYARGGTFVYEDHASPWSVVAPNLQFSLVRAENLDQYVGLTSFHDGTVQIQQFLPMQTEMSARFVLDGPLVRLEHVDLETDGSQSDVTGVVDFANWPNQTYDVSSRVDFGAMKDIFFADQPWRIDGEGQFSGVFKLFSGGRDLSGTFTSRRAWLNEVAFDDLQGALVWTPDLFSVTHADTEVLGGQSRLQYTLAPLGTPGGAPARFSADYTGLDLFEADHLLDLRGVRLAGTADGQLNLEWRNGHLAATRRGSGVTLIQPRPGYELASSDLPDDPIAPVPEPVPFDSQRRPSALVVGGELHYEFGPGTTTFRESWAATSHTYVAFSGGLAGDGVADFPFRVTSHDWQESDRLLAVIMTAVSGPTGAVEVGGRGTFAGRMTGRFSSPRVEGRFAGEAIRAWGVTWGDAVADIVIERGYVDLMNTRITRSNHSIVPEGRFALGFRRDGMSEIDAVIAFSEWPMADLRTAFQLDDWSIDGTVADADLELHGQYRQMYGTGTVTVSPGVAWGEQFETARAEVALEGDGMLIRGLELRKATGTVRGSARIGWDGTYAFNADGEDVPVSELNLATFEGAPLSGQLDFQVSGAGEFEAPTYTFDGAVQDLFVGDEGVGAVTGRLVVDDDVMTVERVLAASSRLVARMSGTVRLDDQWTSDLDFRFQEASIDPYLKFVLTDDISPYTRIVAAGSVSVQGPLVDTAGLDVRATIDQATLTLPNFELASNYEFTNDGPILLAYVDEQLRVDRLTLRGGSTNLTLTGGADTGTRTWDLSANGDATLSILQLFFGDVTASGAATVNASLVGSFDAPRLTGRATVTDGRLRPLGSPHGLEAINGGITFGSGGMVVDGLRGRVGSGDVVFGGSITLDRYTISEFNLTATGRSMRLRYPEGFNSTVDMNLLLTGPYTAPRLSGTVDVLRVAYLGQLEPEGGFFGLGGADAEAPPAAAPGPVDGGTPIALYIQVTAPRMTFIETRMARIEGQADLEVRGTFDEPQLVGSLEILGGEVLFNGNRFFVREGAIDFTDPTRIDPIFDVSAETRPRASGQSFTVNARVTGTIDRLNLSLDSDPWLPVADIVRLIFGEQPNLGTAELRALGSSQELQQQMLQTAGAALLTSPLTSRVGAVFERTGVIDTVQITPLLASETSSQLNPTARITLGSRISPRVYLTYSRTFNAAQEEIILLEYDQSDRISWVLSRNEDRTFALDLRLRYVF